MPPTDTAALEGSYQMTDPWIRPVEQIVLWSISNDCRIIGFTSPEPRSGVSTLARSVASVCARSGLRTLLFDMTQPVSVATQPSWFPLEGDPSNFMSRHPLGFDCLTAHPTPATQFAFNNVEDLRQTLAQTLAGYAKIVLDIPALLDLDSNSINPAAAAAACDSTLLVCVKGRVSHDQLGRAVAMSQSAGAKIAGTIVNDMG
jgi:Mrp family chromosome partitioning ATPase